MNDFALQLSLVIVGLAVGAVPVAIFFVATELRAIRKVRQARWYYDRCSELSKRRWEARINQPLDFPEDDIDRDLDDLQISLLYRPYVLERTGHIFRKSPSPSSTCSLDRNKPSGVPVGTDKQS